MPEQKISARLQADFRMSRALAWTFVIGTMILYIIISYFLEGNDISTFLIKWCRYYDAHSFLETYDAVAAEGRAINYPPAFPLWLYLVHSYVNSLVRADRELLAQFIIRIPALVLHAGILFYFILKKEYRWLVFWSLNPWWFVITAMYGQTDEWFCFLMLLMLKSMQKKKFIRSGLFLVLAAMWKTQGALLAVPYFFGLFLYEPCWQKRLKHIFKAGCLGYLCFLPFTIYHKNLLYPVFWYLKMGTSNDGSSYMGNLVSILLTLVLPEGAPNLAAWLMRFSFILSVVCVIVSAVYLKHTKKYWLSVFLFLLMYQQFTVRQMYRYAVYPGIALTYLIFKDELIDGQTEIFGKLFEGAGLFVIFMEICVMFLPAFATAASYTGICVMFILAVVCIRRMWKEKDIYVERYLEDKSVA